MTNRELRPGLWYVSTADGSAKTYGSYLLHTEEGFLSLGTVPRRYARDWLVQVRHVVGDAPLRWAVLLGAEGDRACAKELLRTWPKAAAIGSAQALYQLDGPMETDSARITVRSHRSMTLGGRRLRFQVIPDRFDTPGVYVLDQESGTLFTADAFGSHFASQHLLVSEIPDKEAYFRGVQQYFYDISGPKRRRSLEAAAAFVRENGIRLICPACGPAADYDLERLLSIFTPAQEPEDDGLTAALIYRSGRYIGELAERIEAGLRESGPIRIRKCDLDAMSREEAANEASRCSAFLFGTPQVKGDAARAVWDVVAALTREDCQGKPAAVFTEPQGNAAENLRARLEQLGCDLTLPDHTASGKPDETALQNAFEYGYDIGRRLQKIPNPRRPALVKCLVCGEVFDASLGVCPVCGVGLEQCVPAEADESAYRADTQNRYLILGGGVAAVSAAEAIRLRDRSGTITLLSAEDCLPINRPMLTKDLVSIAGGPDGILIHDLSWYEERSIVLHLGVRALSVDTAARTVCASDGAVYLYDKLIYATGAECFVPPFPGYDTPGVLTIRHIGDSQELFRRAQEAKNAVVIGGGVLGLEAASELVRMGVHVTVLEAAPQIVGRQIDAQSAAVLRAAMERLGIACHEGVSIAGIEGGKRVAGVRLSDGQVFPAEFVVVSCGNRGNVQTAQAAGIQVDRSIVVNRRMETSAADVYACGDCAQLDGVNFQLWQEASEQGRIAGANAAGEPAVCASPMLGLSLKGFGLSLFAIGDAGKQADRPYRTVEVRDGVSARSETYWFYGGRLQGAALFNAPEKTIHITQAVRTQANYEELF